MTYIELVNAVLRRMREKEVNTVNSTAYSQLIGDLINDVKSEVESTWNWDALRTTALVTTAPSYFNYVLEGATQSSRLLHAWNDTEKRQLAQMGTRLAEERFLTQRNPNKPMFYNFNGLNNQGFLQVDVWPIPDGVYNLTFNLIVPQPELLANDEPINVPWRPVVEGTVSRAIQERGEDGGTTFEAAMRRYERALSDAVAFDANLHPDEINWYAE